MCKQGKYYRNARVKKNEKSVQCICAFFVRFQISIFQYFFFFTKLFRALFKLSRYSNCQFFKNFLKKIHICIFDKYHKRTRVKDLLKYNFTNANRTLTVKRDFTLFAIIFKIDFSRLANRKTSCGWFVHNVCLKFNIVNGDFIRRTH